MKRTITASVAVAAALALGLTGCAGSSIGGGGNASEASEGPIKIGFIVPKTGVYAAIGTDLERGAQIYLDQHDGKIDGREVELVTIDEGATAETGTAAAQRLISSEEVDVVTGVVNSATAAAIAPMFADADIPVLSSAQVENDYWWRVGWTNPPINQSMVDYLLAERGDDPLYIIAADYAQGHNIAEAFKKGFEEGGGTVVDTVFTPFGTTQDFQPYLARIKDSGAKMVYAFYAGGEAINFVKQFNEFGLSKDIGLYANQGLTEGVLPAQGAAAEGVTTNGTYSAALDTELNKTFVADYVAAFDAAPSVYSEAQYASFQVIEEALKSGEASFQDAIASVGDITTPRGTWFFDEGRAPTQVVYLRLATDEDGTMINKVVEEIGVYDSFGVRQ